MKKKGAFQIKFQAWAFNIASCTMHQYVQLCYRKCKHEKVVFWGMWVFWLFAFKIQSREAFTVQNNFWC